MHIPKCAGYKFREIFEFSGLKTINYCTFRCSGSRHADPGRISEANCPKKGKDLIPAKDLVYFLVHHQLPRPKQSTDYIITSIRNPYSWYVSRWSYHIRCGLYQWGRNSNNVSAFQKWLRLHVGLYTQRFFEICYKDGEMIIDHFIKVEDISIGLQELYEKTDLSLKQHSHNTLLNKSEHLRIMNYYTPELYALVYQYDGLIFDLFGYHI